MNAYSTQHSTVNSLSLGLTLSLIGKRLEVPINPQVFSKVAASCEQGLRIMQGGFAREEKGG